MSQDDSVDELFDIPPDAFALEETKEHVEEPTIPKTAVPIKFPMIETLLPATKSVQPIVVTETLTATGQEIDIENVIKGIDKSRIRNEHPKKKDGIGEAYNLKELQKFCRALGLQATGKKETIVSRLLDFLNNR